MSKIPKLETAGVAVTNPAKDETQLVELPNGEPVPSTKAARSCLSSNFGVLSTVDG